jgi:hypothetical protein
MRALGNYMRQGFEDRMVRHIAQTFPAQFKKLAAPPSGDAAVRMLIQQGIERAARYEITIERDVGRFIEVLVVLGADFETRADGAWAQSILKDVALSGNVRMELIHQQLPNRVSEAARPPGSRTR